MTSSLRLGRVAEPDPGAVVTMDARDDADALTYSIIQESTVFPSSGNAGNGKPIFDWDQAAAQLTRGGFTWSPTLGQSVTVTYAFRSTAPTTMPDGTDGFTRFSAVQIAAAEAALQLWADVANITFVRVGSGTTGEGAYSNNATILFSNYTTETGNAAGFAYLPSPSATGSGQVQGDIWIDGTETVNQNPVSGEYGMQVLAHEIGHAIGLRHPSDYDGGSPTYDADATWWQDSRMFTIMSYFGSLALGGSLGAFAAGPQLLDIAAAQRLYGANTTARTGDTIYGFNSNSGRPHYTITSASQAAVFAIWDGGGNDTLDLSGYSQGGEIDLRPEGFSGGGPGNGGGGGQYNISIARGVIIENAIGGSGNDIITGNAASNILTGNAGDDTLDGGAGNDILRGGSGTDTVVLSFQFNSGYSISGNGADFTISGPSGVDRYINVERVSFSNGVTVTSSQLRPTAMGDFNGDGRADALLYNAANGNMSELVATNFNRFSWSGVRGTIDSATSIAGIGDFNGDGKADVLLYQGSTGYVSELLTNGAGAFTWSGVIGVIDPLTSIAGVGDFNGDGKADVLLYQQSTGRISELLMNAAGAFVWSDVIGVVDPLTSIAGVGDFNGDGKDDVLLHQGSTGYVSELITTATGAFNWSGVIGVIDAQTGIAGVGSFNADARDDVLLFQRATGYVSELLATSSGAFDWSGVIGVVDPLTNIAGVGDINGDSRSDIFLYQPSSGYLSTLFSNPGGDLTWSGLMGTNDSSWLFI